MNYDIHDKELLAVVEAFKQWRVYLEGSKYPTQVYTDHKNLLYWTSTKQLNRRQVRWAETLASYDFRINHVRGTENGRADALSRRPDYEEGSRPGKMSILEDLNGTLTYRKPPDMLAEMRQDITAEQKAVILRERHDDTTAGHPGIDKTLELVTRDYDPWPGLRKDVTEYVRN